MKCKCGHTEWKHSELLGGCVGDGLGPGKTCSCSRYAPPAKPRRRATAFQRWDLDEAGRLRFWERANVQVFPCPLTLAKLLNDNRVVPPAKVRPCKECRRSDGTHKMDCSKGRE